MHRGISYLHILLGAGASLWPNVNAHLAAWHKGMYCLNGSDAGVVDLNSAAVVTPLYQLTKSDWWFHHINGCDDFPPAEGDFLELPAGGSFTVEIASNQAKTSLSYNGIFTSAWPDGNTYPEDYNVPTCITSPNMHTQNQSMAAGTAFAISYTSDIHQVTAENLVVFSVRYNTPWKRITSYDVPAAMPACPPGGCICGWGWVPNGCGQPNMYHQPFKCKVTGATSTTPVAPAKPAVWCEGNQTACTPGAKQMIYWNQNDGNNIKVDGYDLEGNHKSPPYNMKLGFKDGAQNDIFVGAVSSPAPQAFSSKAGSGSIANFDSGAGSPIKSTPSSSLPPYGSSPSPLPSGNPPPSHPPSGNSTSPPPSGDHPSYPPSGNPPKPSPSGDSPSHPPSGKSASCPPSGKEPSHPPSGNPPSHPPSGKSASRPPSGKEPSHPPSYKAPSHPPSGKAPSHPPSGNPPSHPPSGKAPSHPPSGKRPSHPPSGESTPYGSYTPAGSPPSGSGSTSSSTRTAGKPNKAPSCSKSKKPHQHQHRQSRRAGGTDW